MAIPHFIRSLFQSTLRTRPPAGMRERVVQCMGQHGLHHIAYTEWGDPDNPKVLLCVHGFTRNCRDFDALAQALCKEYRVVCPDVVGRGRSDWLDNKDDYTFPLYVSDMVTLIARLGALHVDWVGTSMGGLIGILLASEPHSPVRRLVLNDVGPIIPAETLREIGKYVGRAPAFPTMDAVEAYVREVGASFGKLTDEQWRHITRYSVHPVENGYGFTYDPGLGDLFHKGPILLDVGIWDAYDRLRHPVLAIRGAESTVLRPDVWQNMAQRGPKAKLIEFKGMGHAPMLMSDDQIRVVRDFLLSQPSQSEKSLAL